MVFEQKLKLQRNFLAAAAAAAVRPMQRTKRKQAYEILSENQNWIRIRKLKSEPKKHGHMTNAQQAVVFFSFGPFRSDSVCNKFHLAWLSARLSFWSADNICIFGFANLFDSRRLINFSINSMPWSEVRGKLAKWVKLVFESVVWLILIDFLKITM